LIHIDNGSNKVDRIDHSIVSGKVEVNLVHVISTKGCFVLGNVKIGDLIFEIVLEDKEVLESASLLYIETS